ncbi:MAG: type III-A CRISPR-associated RAMP protein Csm5, partial [Rubrobacter sp.]
MRLRTAAPVRVGGREQQISKLEFVSHGDSLHAVSPTRLGAALLGNSLRALDDWNTEVLTRGQNVSLTAFLRRGSFLTPELLRETIRYSVECSHRDVNVFQPHARDARAKLFVPGTAIKGAIRAAVLWALACPDRTNRYVRETGESRARFYARDLDRELLQSYPLAGRNAGGGGPRFDLMRAVKVSDAYGSVKSRVEKILVQSYTDSGRGRVSALGASDTIYVECLEPGSTVEFDFKVDQHILESFRRESPDLPFEDEGSLLDLVRTFYKEVWDFERRYYGLAGGVGDEEPSGDAEGEPPSFEDWLRHAKGVELDDLSRRQRNPLRAEYRRAFDLFETDSGGGIRERSPAPAAPSAGVRDGEIRLGRISGFYGGECPGFRLGWGSGLMSTTLDLHLGDEEMGKVLKLVNSRHHRGDPSDGPKSRRLVERGGEPRWPMGWA